MPTYEYICDKCGKQFELFQSISSEALKVCPKDLCGQKRWGKGKVKRAISAGAGLIFKGSGFYITDYRSENYKQGAKRDVAPSSSSSSSDSKTSSTTPAKPAESKPAKPSPAKT